MKAEDDVVQKAKDELDNSEHCMMFSLRDGKIFSFLHGSGEKMSNVVAQLCVENGDVYTVLMEAVKLASLKRLDNAAKNFKKRNDPNIN